MKVYGYNSIEEILDRINKEDSKKLDFARYFMIKKMGIDCDEDSKITISPVSDRVFMSLIASIIIEWESICITSLTSDLNDTIYREKLIPPFLP